MDMYWVENFIYDVYVTYVRGLPPQDLAVRLLGANPPLVLGEARGWSYAVESVERQGNSPERDDAHVVPLSAGGNEVAFFSTRSWDLPSTFVYARDGRVITEFGLGCGGEENERAGADDVLGAALEAAGIVGDDDSRYEADEDFNIEGAESIRVIVDFFGLPAPPLGVLDRPAREAGTG